MDDFASGDMDKAAEAAKNAASGGAAAAKDAAGKAAETIRNAASAARDTVTQSSAWQSGAELAGGASDRMAEAADYVMETEPADLWNDAREYVKARPVGAMVAAACLGFFIGRSVRRM